MAVNAELIALQTLKITQRFDSNSVWFCGPQGEKNGLEDMNVPLSQLRCSPPRLFPGFALQVPARLLGEAAPTNFPCVSSVDSPTCKCP